MTARLKVEEMAFRPNLIECAQCPPTGCDLTCVWPGEREPLLWQGDGA